MYYLLRKYRPAIYLKALVKVSVLHKGCPSLHLHILYNLRSILIS
jgi:hypothetical protein